MTAFYNKPPRFLKEKTKSTWVKTAATETVLAIGAIVVLAAIAFALS